MFDASAAPRGSAKMAEARGWQVNRIRIDDGCYQIEALMKTGGRSRQDRPGDPLNRQDENAKMA